MLRLTLKRTSDQFSIPRSLRWWQAQSRANGSGMALVSSLLITRPGIAYIEEHGILIYQEGDEYPVDPMTVIDTRPYVEQQRTYFEQHQQADRRRNNR